MTKKLALDTLTLFSDLHPSQILMTYFPSLQVIMLHAKVKVMFRCGIVLFLVPTFVDSQLPIFIHLTLPQLRE